MSDPSGEVDELTAAVRAAALAYVNIAVALTNRARSGRSRFQSRASAASHHLPPVGPDRAPGRTGGWHLPPAPEPEQAQAQPPSTLAGGQGAGAGLGVGVGVGDAVAGERYAPLLLQVVEPAVAEAVLADPGWPALAARLAAAEQEGLDPKALLGEAAAQRAMSGARRPALLLAHRLENADSHRASQPAQQRRADLPSPRGDDAQQRVAAAVARTYPQPLAPPAEPRAAGTGQPIEASSALRRPARAATVADVLARSYPTPLSGPVAGSTGRRGVRQGGTLRPTSSEIAPSRRSWVLLLPSRTARRNGS